MSTDAGDAAGSGVRAWRRISSEIIADYEWFKVRKTVAESPRNGEPFPFHVLDMDDWVSVVAVTSEGQIVMVEQVRHGTDRVTLEFPSGSADPGEDPATAGARELEEETGFSSEGYEVLAEFWPNPAMQSNRMFVVHARACEPNGKPDQDEGEDVKVRLVDARDIPDLINSGEIDHALAIMTWFFFERRAATL